MRAARPPGHPPRIHTLPQPGVTVAHEQELGVFGHAGHGALQHARRSRRRQLLCQLRVVLQYEPTRLPALEREEGGREGGRDGRREGERKGEGEGEGETEGDGEGDGEEEVRGCQDKASFGYHRIPQLRVRDNRSHMQQQQVMRGLRACVCVRVSFNIPQPHAAAACNT